MRSPAKLSERSETARRTVNRAGATYSKINACCKPDRLLSFAMDLIPHLLCVSRLREAPGKRILERYPMLLILLVVWVGLCLLMGAGVIFLQSYLNETP